MARRARLDGPDTWHHVMNRGVGKRTIFENDRDRRMFLSLVAREVRRGRLELHAYSLMLNHYHLLVRSPRGELSSAMHRIQMLYSRWFNRTRDRDGPLMRNRFRSRPIDSLRYRRTVLGYIHANPVEARLVVHPTEHEWTSAAAHCGRRPRWLAGDWVEAELRRRGGVGVVPAERLDAAFPPRMDAQTRAWVERQLHTRPKTPSEREVVLRHAGSPKVVRWAVHRARVADGVKSFHPVLPAHVVEAVLARARRRAAPLLHGLAHRARDVWVVVRAGLLRLLAGCTHKEIGIRVRRHAGTISKDLADHRRLLRRDAAYATILSTLAHRALAA